MMAAGLPCRAEPRGGREAQSMAFFNAPGTPKLYSAHEATRRPGLFAVLARHRLRVALASTSPLKRNGRGRSGDRIPAGQLLSGAQERLKDPARRLPPDPRKFDFAHWSIRHGPSPETRLYRNIRAVLRLLLRGTERHLLSCGQGFNPYARQPLWWVYSAG